MSEMKDNINIVFYARGKERFCSIPKKAKIHIYENGSYSKCGIPLNEKHVISNGTISQINCKKCKS
jgi:hypothetical protein